ncbi:coiled-coil domain-containing protein 137 isoform X2 [Conger conger]|nr:coiled-coil domain-containing protein 137 isoform X2 [Conger conger]
MKSKERMKLGTKKTKKKNEAAGPKQKAERPQAPGEISVPHFRRRQRESEKAYLRRMNRETQHVLFLTKNQLDRKPEMAQEEQEHPADKRKSEKKREFDKVRLQKLKKKKAERREEEEEKELLIDTVRFGEVAMAPPCLTTKPKKATSKKEGAMKGLLLNSLLGHTPVSTAKPSMARQRMMEEERQRVVLAYRHMKKMKQERKGLQAAGLDKLKDPQ